MAFRKVIFFISVIVAIGSLLFFSTKRAAPVLPYDDLSPLVFANSSDVARKMQTPVKVGLGWSLKYNQSHPGVDKQKGSTEGSFYVTTTGKNLQEFINNLDGVRNLDIEFISPERELRFAKRENPKTLDLNIRIVPVSMDRIQADTIPIRFGEKRFILDRNVAVSSDGVVSILLKSVYARAYMYFDRERNVRFSFCEMWQYIAPSEGEIAIRECIVRSLGLMGDFDADLYLRNPNVDAKVQQALQLLYCPDVKEGMKSADMSSVFEQKTCQ